MAANISAFPYSNMFTFQQLENDEIQRLEAISRAWIAYNGQLEMPFLVKPGGADDNVNANFCRVIVDKGVSFLFGQELQFNLNPKDAMSDQRDDNETWLDQVWAFNKKMLFLQRVAVNGAVTGHAFIKIVIDESQP